MPKMKRLYTAIALCAALLLIEAAIFLPHTSAKDDPIAALLRLPAPPPPNPFNRAFSSNSAESYDKSKPPKDDAPTAEMLDYWAKMSSSYQNLRYNPEPSDKTLDRLMSEIERDPKLLPDYINSLGKTERAAEFVKRIYDAEGTAGAFSKDQRAAIKQWLTYNSKYFTNDLYRLASGVGSTDTYVTSHDELLALVRVDWEKAKPLVDRLRAGDQNKAGRALAAWAAYRHALDSDSLGDTERYRDELKSIVEDKSLGAPMRDLAMDALVSEKEWAGRDDWYMSLLGDETLADMGGYTGLTTLILISPPGRYIDKMIELLKSSDPVVRAAAVKNLLSSIDRSHPEIIRAMLPWLEDKNWAKESADERQAIVAALRQVRLPESVTGLLKVLDERGKRPVYGANAPANMAANTAANAARSAANTGPSIPIPPANSVRGGAAPVAEETYFPYRASAIGSLATQADPRAVPALRRVMSEVEAYERRGVVEAILACKGYTVAEQIDALEYSIKRFTELAATSNANLDTSELYIYSYGDNRPPAPVGQPISAGELKSMIGAQLMQSTIVSDELAAAVVDRIAFLDSRDPKMAETLRTIVLRWQNAAINMMLLSDVKRDRAPASGMLRLLAGRAELREKQPSDVFDLRTGSPTSVGFAACMIEDAAEYQAIFEGDNADTKTALFACARLIRSPLPITMAAELARSDNKRLALAAERYLESEDSPQARAAVLALHPNEAKILGATTAFFVDLEAGSEIVSTYLDALFASVDPTVATGRGYGYYETSSQKETEDALIKEVKSDNELRGVYAYDGNFVRIYKDKVLFSWDYDKSRYRERELEAHEFDSLKALLTENRVDELTPFLSCPTNEYCPGKELVMLGRNGGRRVFVAAAPLPPFFAALEKYFTELKSTPGSIKYALSKEIPGLEIVMADENLHVETVWKNGDDLRVAVTDRIVRKRVKDEIEKSLDEVPDGGEPPLDGADGAVNETEQVYEKRLKLQEKRAWEGISWRRVTGGADAGPADQPAGFEYIPLRDGASVQATISQWKARAGDVEIRTDQDGLFKFSRGKPTRLRQGWYSDPVIMPNGQWVVVYTYDDEAGPKLVRVNLVNGREFPIELPEYMAYLPTAYVSTLNKVLAVQQNEHDGEEGYEGEGEAEIDDTVGDDPGPSEMLLIDPLTGATQPVSGEFRPLTQQTYRPLQKTAKLNEYWAAIPDVEKNETIVGVYDTKTFGFKTLLRVPKMTFNSMNMWVDEAERQVYFVYRGHLLRMPLGK